MGKGLAAILDNNRPDDTVIAWRAKQVFTLKEFRNSILQLIALLSIHPQQRWALYFEDAYYFTVAFLALLYCGKTPVLLGYLKPAVLKEQQDQFDAVLTDLSLLEESFVIINTTQLDNHSMVNLPVWPKQQYLVLFTSGSTGIPKPIHKAIDLLVIESQLLLENFGEKLKQTKLVATVSHQHLYGLTFRIILPLLAGIPFNADMIRYHEQLQVYQQQPLVVVSSPAFLKRLDKTLAVVDCKLVFSAGGALTYEQAQQVKKSFNLLPQEIYGSSESGIVATRVQSTINQYWQPFGGIHIIQNEDQSISVKSPHCEEQLLQLADRIKLVDNGFELLGRKDNIVKIEESRVSLSLVERRLKNLPAISEAVVLVLQIPQQTALGAVLVLSEEGKKQLALQGSVILFRSLRQQLKEWLELIAIPKRWRIVEELPQNTQGKIIYPELQELFR